MNEQIVILDFGSQYTQVIARRIRECNVYSIILCHDTPAVEIAALSPSGIILSGGPSSVYAADAPRPAEAAAAAEAREAEAVQAADAGQAVAAVVAEGDGDVAAGRGVDGEADTVGAAWKIRAAAFRDLLLHAARQIMGNTICALGDAAAMPVISFVNTFREDFERHIALGRCPHE